MFCSSLELVKHNKEDHFTYTIVGLKFVDPNDKIAQNERNSQKSDEWNLCS